ncbi:HtaA domain-containing protein [Capillimicrobium parvum]|uniref:Htaa domain-containing protein n=1 Tax=Capillimicrobium parvum TaxID=2884022 RepID=A0A9E6Y0P9_9ACTN|nr:HtaA domain-containing protein [Capillimicrobium parvum]UGS37924.1 hypothetical protein DSM104329_04346 [Capillimicrobium parvum]
MSRALSAAALSLAALLAPAALAAAQPTRIALDERAGLTAVAVAPATASSRGAALPTRTVTVAGPRATVTHRGALRLRSRGRTLELSAIRVRIGARSALTARVAGQRRRLFVIAAPATRRTVDATGASITDAPLRLTRSGAALLRERLRAPAVRPGQIGRIDLDADATTAPAGAPTAPTVTGPPTPGGAALTARPATAVPIVGGRVRWSPRASWLGYLQQGEGASAEGGAAFDGATYALPVSGGWFDRATGRGVIATTGTTRFRYGAHDIDSAYGAWTYDLAATTPKAVATIERDSSGIPGLAGRRRPIQLVKGAGPGALAAGAAGETVTWTDLPVTLSAEGVELFLAYLYDSDQGRITIEASLG